MNSEETQTARLYAVLGWLDQNRKRLIYATVTLAVVGSVGYVYNYFQAQKELQAGDALVGLNKAPEAGGKASNPAAAAYLKVAGDYPGTTAAEHALLLAGSALFAEEKYKEASDKFAEFIAKYGDRGDSPLLAAAALGKAACLDAQKETDKALEAYKQVSTAYPNDAAAAQAKLASAFLYETKNQPDQALKLYNELAPPEKPNAWSREVEPRREQLLLKHPQLVPPRVPAAPKITQLPVAPKAANPTNAVSVAPKAGVKAAAAPVLVNPAPAKKSP